MAITKYITSAIEVAPIYDERMKVAAFTDVFVPPKIQRYVDTLDPDPRLAYLHMIAMSDGDYFGSNLNGDIFTTDQLTGMQTPAEAAKNTGSQRGVCVPRYETFETARFFKHHNNKPTSPSYGDMPCAAWNEPMRRVELIIRIAREPAPELRMECDPRIMQKFDQRGYLTGSMGTTISHEKCRICGHENEFVPQRCDHLKHQMNTVLPDGRLVSAENFGCRFFDYSDVGIPADPIAYSLSKVASAAAGGMPNLAHDFVTVPDWATKRSAIEKHTPVTLTAADISYDEPVAKTHHVTEYTGDELKLAAADGIAALVATSALMGIVLSPAELMTATLYAEAGKTAEVGEHMSLRGFDTLRLDKFSVSAYAALSSKVAARSGFAAPCFAAGWEPAKIAAAGHGVVADYYAHYRQCLSSFPVSAFAKIAARNPLLAPLVRQGNTTQAAYHLAYAGIGL